MDAYKKGDHAKLVQQMATALRLHHELVNVPELFRPIIDKRLKENPNELDTIICYIGLNSRKATQELFEFIGKCLQKFPTDPFLVEMRAIGFSMGLNQHKEAIKLIETALRSHPNSIRLLYCRANFFSMDDEVMLSFIYFFSVPLFKFIYTNSLVIQYLIFLHYFLIVAPTITDICRRAMLILY